MVKESPSLVMGSLAIVQKKEQGIPPQDANCCDLEMGLKCIKLRWWTRSSVSLWSTATFNFLTFCLIWHILNYLQESQKSQEKSKQ